MNYKDNVEWREIIAPLLSWYELNKRDLPWRHTKDPYCIWVSEIMLQQTRVEAVKTYYKRFLERLPDIASLAGIEEDELLKLWEGLGYYNRVRNMQTAARQMLSLYDGRFPDRFAEISKLKGIGSYTAGAISSIAFEIQEPAVDGNVLRVMARLMALNEDILKQSTKRMVEDLLRQLIPEGRAGDFNQALIELGALVCVPNSEAKCGECPLSAFCKAKALGIENTLPVRKKQKERRKEKKTILLFRDGENLAILKRPEKGLLAGMYEFPNVEGWLDGDQVVAYAKEIGLMPIHVKQLPESKHIFSHVEWEMIGYEIRVDELEKVNRKEFLFVHPEQIKEEYPIPTAFKAYRE